jgi:hypothetical protein
MIDFSLQDLLFCFTEKMEKGSSLEDLIDYVKDNISKIRIKKGLVKILAL